MSLSNKKFTPTDLLVSAFLEKSKALNANIELIQVLRSRTYKIGESNVLVRAAAVGNRRYFFGINYLTIEEISNLENPFIAFICGSIEQTLILPAKVLFKYLDQISHDRNGEYKINIDNNSSIILTGKNNRINCGEYLNNWDLLLAPPTISEEPRNTVEESFHSILQGRLIEIGNLRGYQTFCPNKSKKFNERTLDDLSTLKNCPELQFSDYNLLRQIDVLWFKSKGSNYIPEYAFEVELSTGVWSGVGRLSTLLDYSNVGLYVIANDKKKFSQVAATIPDIQNRYKFIPSNSLGDLYSAELNLIKLRIDIGL